MLKALQQAAWIAAFAFVVAFWVLMATRASMSPDTNEQKQHQHEPKKSNNPSNPNADEGGQHYRDTWTKIKQSAQEYWAQFVDHVERRNAVYVALSGIAVAAFTLALFFATWLLWFGGERHSERELRAYVAIAGGNIRVANITQGGQGFQIVIELKNSGQTPGYDFTTWICRPSAPVGQNGLIA
jgi:hypothetical protein